MKQEEHEISWNEVINLIKNERDMPENEKKQKANEIFHKRVVTDYYDVVGIRDTVDDISNIDCVILADLFLKYIPSRILEDIGGADRYGNENGAAYAAARKLKYPLLRAARAFSGFRAELTGR